MLVERKDLKIGTSYFLDGRRKETGVFVERDENSIYFDCGNCSSYTCSGLKGKEHLVPFDSEGSAFEQKL